VHAALPALQGAFAEERGQQTLGQREVKLGVRELGLLGDHLGSAAALPWEATVPIRPEALEPREVLALLA